MGMQKEMAARKSRRPRALRQTSFSTDWDTVDADQLRRTIAVVAKAGGALRFGYTRDGGAYAIGIYGLGEPYTEYLRPGDDVEGFLGELREAYKDAPEIPAVDGDGGSRRKG